MKISISMLTAGVLLLLVYSISRIEFVGYREVPSEITSSMLGGAVCRCGGASDPDCKTSELPSGNIGITTLEECNNIGKKSTRMILVINCIFVRKALEEDVSMVLEVVDVTPREFLLFGLPLQEIAVMVAAW